MTKSTKAKKQKKADFAKVKLKVGKTLKKASNETRTDFKARKIILKEQLADLKTDGQLVSKKKHTIKELLSRLNHQSTFVREDGLVGLKELVQANDSCILIPHLPVLLPGLATCILDLETSVRSSATKLIELLVVKMKNNLQPYYHLFVTHLSCAMVNLNTGVQGDSLHLMNVLIKQTPILIASHADTLLYNFINLISRKASSMHPNTSTTTAHSLIVNPDNKLTALKWRLKLLRELGRYLSAILKAKSTSESSYASSLWESILNGCNRFDDNNQSAVEKLKILTNPQELQKFSESLVPLLFQTWTEVAPSQKEIDLQGLDAGTALNDEAAETLECVLEIVYQLWNIVQICTDDDLGKQLWFTSFVKLRFKKSILPGFPFCRHESAIVMNKKKKKKSKSTIESSTTSDMVTNNCHDLNITIANLTLQLDKNDLQIRMLITRFLSALLSNGDNDGNYNIGRLTNVISLIIKSHACQDESGIDELITSTFLCYKRLHPLKKDRQLLLDILVQITDIELRSLWRIECTTEWINELVRELTEEVVHSGTLKAALLFKQRNTADIIDLLSDNKDQIYENLLRNKPPNIVEEEILKLSCLLLNKDV